MLTPAVLNISVPLDRDVDGNRKFIQLNIDSVAKWQDLLDLEAKEAKAKGLRKRPAIDRRDPHLRQFILANGDPPADQATDIYRVRVADGETPNPPESERSSRSSTPVLATDEDPLLGRADGCQAVDVEVLEQRIRTWRILEGKLTPPPDRSYWGECAEYFRERAREEDRERQRPRIRKGPQPSGASAGGLQGWRFLRDILLRGLTEAGAKRFPAYHPTQRAYLLSYRIDGGLVAPKVRNLDACPKKEMLALLKKIGDKEPAFLEAARRSSGVMRDPIEEHSRAEYMGERYHQ
ncbi:hypothetical protein ACJ41O_002197 [Fusarium nematophilum]